MAVHIIDEADDFFDVVLYLRQLDINQVKQLGTLLGLDAFSVNNMQTLPDDMVRAWLRKEGNVTVKTGDILTWEVLAEKLKKMGQNGVAGKITKEKCTGGSRATVLTSTERKTSNEQSSGSEQPMASAKPAVAIPVEEPMYMESERKTIIKAHKPRASAEVDAQPLKEAVKVILLTCNENEKWAVFEKLKPPTPNLERSLLLPENNSVIGKFGGYTVAVVTTEQGKKSEIELKLALDVFPNAEAIIGVGVAYGKDYATVKYADVMISDLIEDASQISAIQGSAGGQIEVAQRGQRAAIKNELLRYFKTKTTEWEDMNEFQVSKEGRIAKAKVGTIVSSETLMRSEDLKKGYMDLMARTIGGDMEGCSMLNMIEWMEHESKRRALSVIVIKGVADYGDNQKDKRWQFTAAKAAADFVHYCLNETAGMGNFVPTTK